MTAFRTMAYFVMPILVFLLCTKPEMVGPPTEQEPQIAVVVVDGNNNRVANAVVTAYRISQGADSSEPTQTISQSATPAAQKLTDGNGACSLYNVALGTYTLVVSDSVNNLAALEPRFTITIIKPEKPEFTDTIVLKALGSISGVVSRGTTSGGVTNSNLKDGGITIKVGEMDLSSITGPSGSYTFPNLPSGIYTLYYYAPSGFFSSKRENVLVKPGKDTLLDTVVLRSLYLVPPAGLSAKYDTARGIVQLSWQKVVSDSLRFYEIERFNLTVPSSKTYLTYDTLFSDTVTAISTGDSLSYILWSIDKRYKRSYNYASIGITVKNEGQ